MKFMHGVGLLLMSSPAPGGAHCLGRGKSGAGIEPSREHRPVFQQRRLARQIGEHALGHVISEVPVTPEASQSRKIHQIDVAIHKFGERCFRAVVNESAQQLTVLLHRCYGAGCRWARTAGSAAASGLMPVAKLCAGRNVRTATRAARAGK